MSQSTKDKHEQEQPLDFIPFEDESSASDGHEEEEEEDVDVEISMTGDGAPVVGRRKGGGGRERPKIPKHMRKSKSQIYDNISVYAPPDSTLIFKCSKKKADWYLSRSLARQLSPTSIHLTFTPAGPGRSGDAYYLEERENKCVMCGQMTADAGAAMLHVVPEQYRKWLPIRLKSHSSHDILVACPECNADWDRGATQLRKRIVQLYQVPLEGVGWVRDTNAGAAKRAAGAVVTEWKRQWEVASLSSSAQDKEEGRRIANSHKDEAEEGHPVEPDNQAEQKDQVEEEVKCGGEGSQEEDEQKKKKNKNKAKKANVLPPHRLVALEEQVLEWWTKNGGESTTSIAAVEDTAASRLVRKRDAAAALGDEQQQGTDASLKRVKGSTMVPNANEAVATTISSDIPPTAEFRNKDHEDSAQYESVPPPPPGHTTKLTRAILHTALNVQPQYKTPDYKEHGQLVMARVLASSPEFHEDKNEAPETIAMWKQAKPLPPKEGWRNVTDFIQMWRKHFLEVAKPRHLSAEWKVDDPVAHIH